MVNENRSTITYKMDQFRHFLAGVDKHQYFSKGNETHSRNTLVAVMINITWLHEL